MSSLKKRLSPSTVKRLPRYFSYVKSLHDDDIRWISSSELATGLGLTSSTVRQDFACFPFSGKSRLGYEVEGLLDMLADMIGANTEWNVIVMGAGNLGRALVLHGEFAQQGFKIVGVFDADRKKVGTKIGHIEVMPVSKLEKFIKKNEVSMGIIAVPDHAAQSVADELVAAGIRGVLNMAMTHITVPPKISVADSRIVASLQQLSHCILYSCRRKNS